MNNDIIDNTVPQETPFKSVFEKRFLRLMSPLETFIHKQTTAGFLLILFSIVAFFAFNSPWRGWLEYIGTSHIGIVLGKYEFSLSINDWISQGLMTLFFFVTGLELKREIIAGKLSNMKEIFLVCAAALGGIIVPAFFYYLINRGDAGAHGWGIPTATDTAFAICILALFARRVSLGLTIFLTALAIFDDIGAIIIISIFYAHEISQAALIGSITVLSLLLLANSVGIRNGWFYSIMGGLLWICVYKAGIHPTVSGLLLATVIPARTIITQSGFIRNIKGLLNRFEQKQDIEISMLGSSGQHSLISDIGQKVRDASTPLQRWEMGLIIPIAIFVLPLFALFNAGFPITQESITEGFSSRVTIGIAIGLVVGKPAGILLFSYIALKSRIGKFPRGVDFKDIVGISLLAGIGFTMSIFFTTLSFPKNPELVELAKLGILTGSLISALLGSLWIFIQFPNLYIRAQSPAS